MRQEVPVGCCEHILVLRDTQFLVCRGDSYVIVEQGTQVTYAHHHGRKNNLMFYYGNTFFFDLEKFVLNKTFCTFVLLLMKFLIVLFPSKFRI